MGGDFMFFFFIPGVQSADLPPSKFINSLENRPFFWGGEMSYGCLFLPMPGLPSTVLGVALPTLGGLLQVLFDSVSRTGGALAAGRLIACPPDQRNEFPLLCETAFLLPLRDCFSNSTFFLSSRWCSPFLAPLVAP